MKNQTEESWLEGISISDMGVGIFVFNAQKSFDRPWFVQYQVSPRDGVSLVKAVQNNITYWDCTNFAEGELEITSYKWIPAKIANFSKVEKSLSNCRSKTLCVSRCASYGCICILGECL